MYVHRDVEKFGQIFGVKWNDDATMTNLMSNLMVMLILLQIIKNQLYWSVDLTPLYTIWKQISPPDNLVRFKQRYFAMKILPYLIKYE